MDGTSDRDVSVEVLREEIWTTERVGPGDCGTVVGYDLNVNGRLACGVGNGGSPKANGQGNGKMFTYVYRELIG